MYLVKLVLMKNYFADSKFSRAGFNNDIYLILLIDLYIFKLDLKILYFTLTLNTSFGTWNQNLIQLIKHVVGANVMSFLF